MGVKSSKHETQDVPEKETQGKYKSSGSIEVKRTRRLEAGSITPRAQLVENNNPKIKELKDDSSSDPPRMKKPLDTTRNAPPNPPSRLSSKVDNKMPNGQAEITEKSHAVSEQRLMCVWQALYATDPSTKGSARKNVVRLITMSFTENPLVKFSVKEFDDIFQGKTIDFEQYANYIHNHLAQSADVYKTVEDAIEDICWEISKEFYDLQNYKLPESDSHKLWQLFNRPCEPGTVPPTMGKEEVNWIMEKLSAHLKQSWDPINTKHICYGELMEIIAEKCFSGISQAASSDAIEVLHMWLVQERAMTGWLNTRTRNQANWTSRLKRWCVLVPGHMEYYENDKMEKKKGEFPLTSSSKVEEIPNHKPFRFKVINSPYLELEVEGPDEEESRVWIAALKEIVDAAKSGTTPMQAILKDRQVRKENGKFVSIDEATLKLKSPGLQKNARPESQSVKKRKIQQKMPSNMKIQDENFQEQVDKIHAIFSKVDLNGNGSIDVHEFTTFIKDMGLHMSDDEIAKIFLNIDDSAEGVLTIDEFTTYFMNNVLDETGESMGESEVSLQAAFLEADRDGTGTVDFREFAEYLWEKKRSMRTSIVMSAFENISGEQGEINFDQFKDLFATQGGLAQEEGHCKSLEGNLKNLFKDADAEGITSLLQERWEAFSAFNRAGSSGESVMTGSEDMVADVLPGNYNLLDLACFSDLPPIEPAHAVIKNFRWVKAQPGGHGQGIFPADYDCKIPIDIATTEHLRYYGASLADSNQVQVSLMYRHGIQDFTYENEYMSDYVQADAGGCGIETHDFSHLDCPMSNASGYFIMGKMEGEELHLTAFKVPTRHTVYVPGGVIHSNDYLKGTWRTMLSDEAAVDHVHLVKRNNHDEGVTKFEFTFKH